MKLRAELIVYPDDSEARRTIPFYDVVVNRLSQFSSIGLRTLQETVRDRRAVELATDSSPIALRTINREGIQRSLGQIRFRFRLGTRDRVDPVHIVPGVAQLVVGTECGQRLGLVESIWEMSSSDSDSEIEQAMREIPVGTVASASEDTSNV